ncbi:MAG: TRAP transporter substrate-binding protein DctP [Deltaproteobacteria bacterium]|nr:TRAP transporter substrate-binding protein DctP [Deltaproteobacteria bacterium]
MKSYKSAIWLLLTTSFLCIPGGERLTAHAENSKTDILRVAMLVPRSNVWVIEAKKWSDKLTEATKGRLSVRIYWGGAAGDERAVIQKMREGQIDASAISSTSLSPYVRQVMIMEAPGLFENYKQLDEVLKTLGEDFETEAYKNGFKILGWGDIGTVRILSKQPIKKITRDMRRMRPWLWTQSAMMKEFYRRIGVTGIPLEIPEVYPGLLSGMIDTVFGSAIAALAARWFTKTPYVTKESSGFITGAFVVARKRWDSLEPDVSSALHNLARKYQNDIVKDLRKMDVEAYGRILKRGVTAVHVEDIPEVQKVAKQLTDHFVGRLYSRELLDKVEKICALHRKP